MKTAFGKPAVFSYQETMSAGRRLEGVHQGQSHCEVYGGSERLHHTKYWRAEQAWKKFERHPTSRSVAIAAAWVINLKKNIPGILVFGIPIPA